MKGSTLALLVGGGLAAAGAVYYLRRKAPSADKCKDLSTLDARAGALCRLGIVDALGNAAGGVAKVTNTIGGAIIKPVLDAINGCGTACSRRNCERIRDTGKIIFHTVSDAERAQWRPGCARLGVII